MREEENKARTARIQAVQEGISAKEQEYMRTEIEKMNKQEASEKAEAEARRTEQEKKQREQQGQLVA